MNIKNKNSMLKADSNLDDLVKTPVLGVGITNETSENILEYIIKNIQKLQKPYYIVTPNPEILLYASSHPNFMSVLNNAKIALCDGMQLYRGARFLGIHLKERIIGTDFVEKLCEKVANWPITVGFLGGGAKIAEMASECLQAKYPGLRVVFIGSEWSEDRTVLGKEYVAKTNNPNTRYKIQNTNDIDILFVAFGFPKQEIWMAKHVGRISVKVMMGVGGAFDQIVNPTLRPPALLHSLGIGWLYRLIREPWRIKRQAKLLQFVQLVLSAKLRQS